MSVKLTWASFWRDYSRGVLLASGLFFVRNKFVRNMCTRIKEHKRYLLSRDRANNITVYHMQTEHSIDWNNATCLAYTTNYFEPVFLESWYTNAEKNSINICRELSATYSRFVANEGLTRCERNMTLTSIDFSMFLKMVSELGAETSDKQTVISVFLKFNKSGQTNKE